MCIHMKFLKKKKNIFLSMSGSIAAMYVQFITLKISYGILNAIPPTCAYTIQKTTKKILN
jgi:hypothetical protein